MNNTVSGVACLSQPHGWSFVVVAKGQNQQRLQIESIRTKSSKIQIIQYESRLLAYMGRKFSWIQKQKHLKKICGSIGTVEISKKNGYIACMSTLQ